MTVSLEQKVDFLLKKLGYAATKTGIAEDESLSGTKKAPFAEAIASPLVVPSSSVWAESDDIPTTPPESTTGVLEYTTLNMTVDPTVSGNRTYLARVTPGDNTSALLGDWVDTQFGANYIVKVYRNNPSAGGVQLPAGGSGSNDTWFFDYSSGVLNFNGTNVPSGVLDSNIYIVAHRYVGTKGVVAPGAGGGAEVSALQSDVASLISKFISVDERIESMIIEHNSYVKLEDNTTSAVEGLPSFYDGIAGGDTSRFVVTQDEDRGVYTLDGVPQPTVELPRADTIEFDLSGLDDEDEFELYINGSLLTAGKSRNGSILSMNASQIPLTITKIYYKNTQTSGLGWVISIVDN